MATEDPACYSVCLRPVQRKRTLGCFMTMSFVRRPLGLQDQTLPQAVSDALNPSAEDLRHERVEDASSFLERVQAKIDSYKAGHATGPGGPVGR